MARGESSHNSFYGGIVAEVPTVTNKYKYAQYEFHRDIRVVIELSLQPWENMCSDSRKFIKEYVQVYLERPMVRLQKWNVKTEWNDEDSGQEMSEGELPYQQNDKHDDTFVPSYPAAHSTKTPQNVNHLRASWPSLPRKRTILEEMKTTLTTLRLRRQGCRPRLGGRLRTTMTTKMRNSENLKTSTSPFLANKKRLRDYNRQDEQVYVIDAKRCGNIGRFLNHLCQPNVFVRNVFVDSQDLCFLPCMSFFAMCSVRAGQELTWDYNYEVASVVGKVKCCYCGAKECTGRLL